MPLNVELSREVALSFRDQLRDARSEAQRDAEAFEEVVFVVERLGCYLSGRQGDLGQYKPHILGLASLSPLFYAVPDTFREVHTPFPQLYDLVRQARNGVMHEGAAARHATTHAIELCLVLEIALMNSYDKVGDFMVRNPVCAALWQPLSFIRQTMLSTSFSYLPVNAGTETKPVWQLVSDKAVARYLRLRANAVPLKDLLVQPLEQAIKGGIKLLAARTCNATDPVNTALEEWDAQSDNESDGQMVLVTRGNSDELLGILMPYDLL